MDSFIPSQRAGLDWISVTDFYNDGDLEIISSNTPGEPFCAGAFVQILLNNGDVCFTDASDRIDQSFSMAGNIQWIDAVDIF